MNNINEIIIKQGILYSYPCVLFKHNNGYAWTYKDETKDLGCNITRDRAIEMFNWNFGIIEMKS